MPKPILALDIDEVLSDTLTAFITFHNTQYGSNLERKDFHSYHFQDVLNLPVDEIVTRLLQFYLEDPDEIAPMPGARAALEELSKKYSLVAITARVDPLQDYTRKWMECEYPGLIQEIHFAHNVHVGCDRKMKHHYCLELGAKILIDDTPEYLAPCKEHGIRGLLFDHPWNSKRTPPGVERVHSWQEIQLCLL